MKPRIGVIGIGNLGSNLIKLMNRNGIKPIYDLHHQKRDNSFDRHTSNLETIRRSNVLFLCAKPKDISGIIKQINWSMKSPELIVSFAAGISLEFLQENLNGRYPIIRGMTNLPISLGKGCVTYIANDETTDKLHNNFRRIMRGPEILEVHDEKLLDVSTVLIGCMPAFTAFIAEEMIEFGVSKGFTYEQSRDLYLATVNGTIEMLRSQTCGDIIDAVSSPSGVTEKGIRFLTTSGVRSTLFTTLYKSYEAISSLSSNRKD